VKASGADPKLCANWQVGELTAALNRDEREIGDSKIAPEQLGWIVKQLAGGKLTGKMAKQVFELSWQRGEAPEAVVEKEGLKPISDAAAIEKLVGKEKAFNSLVGQVMKASKGKADPALVNELLRRKLA
jgi:aspartyl-tRNA(Asn)/glutamyl-tRNA(Gln) amidotransferase subunit B